MEGGIIRPCTRCCRHAEALRLYGGQELWRRPSAAAARRDSAPHARRKRHPGILDPQVAPELGLRDPPRGGQRGSHNVRRDKRRVPHGREDAGGWLAALAQPAHHVGVRDARRARQARRIRRPGRNGHARRIRGNMPSLLVFAGREGAGRPATGRAAAEARRRAQQSEHAVQGRTQVHGEVSRLSVHLDVEERGKPVIEEIRRTILEHGTPAGARAGPVQAVLPHNPGPGPPPRPDWPDRFDPASARPRAPTRRGGSYNAPHPSTFPHIPAAPTQGPPQPDREFMTPI